MIRSRAIYRLKSAPFPGVSMISSLVQKTPNPPSLAHLSSNLPQTGSLLNRSIYLKNRSERIYKLESLEKLLLGVFSHRSHPIYEVKAWTAYLDLRTDRGHIKLTIYTQILRLLISCHFMSPRQREEGFQILFQDVSFAQRHNEMLVRSEGKLWREIVLCSTILKTTFEVDATEQSMALLRDYSLKWGVPAKCFDVLNTLLYVRIEEKGLANAVDFMKNIDSIGLVGPKGEELLPWNQLACNAMVHRLARTPNMDLLVEFFTEAESRPVNITFKKWSTFVLWHLKHNKLAGAEKLLDEMKKEGVPISAILYESIINRILLMYAYSVNPRSHILNVEPVGTEEETLAKAQMYCDEMEREKLQPSVWRTNSFLAFHAAANNHNEVIKLFGTLGNGVGQFQPDVKAFTIVLRSLFATRRIKEVEEVIKLFNESGLKIDGVLIAALMKGFHASGFPEKAISYYKFMEKEGFKPNSTHYHSLMHILCSQKDIGAASKVWAEYLANGYSPSESTYSIFIHGYGMVGDIIAAREAFEVISTNGIILTTTSYNSLMAAYVHNLAFNEALDLYADMKNLQVQEDAFTSNILINLYSKAGDEENMLVYFKRHEFMGYPLSSYTFNPVIRYYCDVGNIASAFRYTELLESACRADRRLDYQEITSHNFILRSLQNEDSVDASINYMADLMAAELPNGKTFIIYLNTLIKKNRFALFRETVNQKVLNHIKPHQSLYRVIIWGMYYAGHKRECKRWFRMMISDGLEPDERTMDLMRRVSMLNWITGRYFRLRQLVSSIQSAVLMRGTAARKITRKEKARLLRIKLEKAVNMSEKTAIVKSMANLLKRAQTKSARNSFNLSRAVFLRTQSKKHKMRLKRVINTSPSDELAPLELAESIPFEVPSLH